MGIKAIDLQEVKDFIIPEDKENSTIFKIGVLDSRIRAKIQDESSSFSISREGPLGETNTQIKMASSNLECVRFGLKGFENFLDKNGKAIEFKSESIKFAGRTYEIVSQSILDILPQKVITILASEIMKENILGESEIKN